MLGSASEVIGFGYTVSEIKEVILALFLQVRVILRQLEIALTASTMHVISRIRSGVYFLFHWPETASIDIRSIHDMAFYFLHEKKCPVSIIGVLNYLLPFYPSISRERVRNNLYGDSDGCFVFFSIAYVGLRSDKHSVVELV